MRSKSEIKTTKHFACEQKSCLNAYANIDITKFKAFFKKEMPFLIKINHLTNLINLRYLKLNLTN